MEQENEYLDPRIAEAKVAERTARLARQRIVGEVQARCQHKFVGETPYISSSPVSNYSPEFRVCLQCGLREDEAPFYKVLTTKRVFKITRDEGRALTEWTDR